jgi:hypothetical protein
LNKLVLKFELDLDFVLIALTVPLKDYRLCFKINKQLNIQFYRIDELCLPISGYNLPSYFSRYHYQNSQTETDFYLLANKGTEGFLIPEMKTVDFFIIIKNFIDEEDLDSFISGLNKIPEVQVAAEVDPKKLKSKENLIF